MLSPQSADPEAEQHDQAEGLSRKAGLPAVDTVLRGLRPWRAYRKSQLPESSNALSSQRGKQTAIRSNLKAPLPKSSLRSNQSHGRTET